jgi:hypothetical protein
VLQSFIVYGVLPRALTQLSGLLKQARVNKEHLEGSFDEVLGRLRRRSAQEALSEFRGQLPQLKIEHLLRVMPALLGPKPVHSNALDQDGQQQRPAENAKRLKRQGNKPANESAPSRIGVRRGG